MWGDVAKPTEWNQPLEGQLSSAENDGDFGLCFEVEALARLDVAENMWRSSVNVLPHRAEEKVRCSTCVTEALLLAVFN